MASSAEKKSSVASVPGATTTNSAAAEHLKDKKELKVENGNVKEEVASLKASYLNSSMANGEEIDGLCFSGQ